MTFMQKNWRGILSCFLIAVPAWLLGKSFPVVGGAVIAILAGMLITMLWSEKGKAAAGINWTSKIILQSAVVLLGFGGKAFTAQAFLAGALLNAVPGIIVQLVLIPAVMAALQKAGAVKEYAE